MSNKNTIQKMFDNKFNKDTNYNKILSKVEGVNNMKNKVLKFSLVPICFIVIICGFTLLKSITLKDDAIKVVDNDKQEIYINKLKDFAATSLDADIQMQEVTNILEEYRALNKMKIPTDLKLSSSYLVYTRKDNKTTQYDVLHGYVIQYEEVVDNMVEKKIIIAFSEDFEPLRDYYIVTDNLKVSKINDTELTIARYNDVYMTTFSYDNLNFDIETRGITQDELIELLTSIIK